MSLCVLPNGQNEGKGTHVSVVACIIRRGNDDNLKWPFKGTIKVSLLNQLEDGQHLSIQVYSADSAPRDISGGTTRGSNMCVMGCFRFVSHHDLSYCSSKNCQYLKDDTMFFRVECIVPELD